MLYQALLTAITGRGEVERYAVSPEQIYNLLTTATGDAVVRGDEPWPGAFLPPTSTWSPSPEELKDLKQKIGQDVWPRCDVKNITIADNLTQYRRLSFGKETFGSLESRSSNARYILARRDGRLQPAEVLFYFRLDVDKTSSGGHKRRHVLSFCSE